MSEVDKRYVGVFTLSYFYERITTYLGGLENDLNPVVQGLSEAEFIFYSIIYGLSIMVLYGLDLIPNPALAVLSLFFLGGGLWNTYAIAPELFDSLTLILAFLVITFIYTLWGLAVILNYYFGISKWEFFKRLFTLNANALNNS